MPSTAKRTPSSFTVNNRGANFIELGQVAAYSRSRDRFESKLTERERASLSTLKARRSQDRALSRDRKDLPPQSKEYIDSLWKITADHYKI
jgi:hypothetical protein